MYQETIDKLQEERLCEPLMRAADPSIYFQNPFLLLQLPITASDREIKKRIQKYSILGKNGAIPVLLDESGSHSFPDGIKDIELRLRKPDIRLIDEFFAFWGDSDDLISFLHSLPKTIMKSKSDDVIQEWTIMEAALASQQDSVHDSAVFAHYTALMVERLDLGKRRKNELRDFFWDRSFSLWERCIHQEETWDFMRERILARQDPRLQVEFVQRIRETLPCALSAIHLHLFIQYFRKNKKNDAEWHQTFIRRLNIPPLELEQALLSTGSTIIDRIQHGCSHIANAGRASDDWREKMETTYRQMDEPLTIVCEILPENAPLREQLCDATARAIVQSVLPRCSQNDQLPFVLSWLDRAEAWAQSGMLRKRIQENRAVVQMQMEREPCWFCQDFFSDKSTEFRRRIKPFNWEVFQAKTVLQPETVTIPRCPRCKSIHIRDRMVNGFSAATAGLLGIAGLTLLLYQSHLSAAGFFSLFILLCGLGAGIWHLRRIDFKQRHEGVRPESDFHLHPAVARLMEPHRQDSSSLREVQQKM
ncbi:MAG: hypothetical protein JXR73_00240 [Candidatus Omnitrophica bacterium]|nr:hypothetical protein [Candidatus Omnitrophota bacterium]